VNKLQQIAANMFEKEDALYVPSGTMGNLIAALSHCQRGEEIILGDECHMYQHEQGGISSLGGISPHVVTTLDNGTLPLPVIKEYIRATDVHLPVTRMVALENTHGRCGGAVLRTEYVDTVGEFLKSYSQSHAQYKANPLRLHVDGARIFNASVFLQEPVFRMTRSVDSISVCLSKGLGAPVGSVLVGSSQFINTARRWRKVLGGGMRQAGVIAAAGVVALTQMVDRLSEDHANAAFLAENIRDIPCLKVSPVETNIVYMEIKEDFYDENKRSTQIIVDKLKQKGVLIGKASSKKMRLVLNYHVSSKDVRKVVQSIHEVFEEL